MPLPDQCTTPAVEGDYRDQYEDLTGHSLRQCPQCQQGRMVTVAILSKSPDHSPCLIDSS
jgi:hypothetical protein